MATIKTFRVKSITEYISITSNLPHNYFRGHSDGNNWKLLPTLFRLFNSGKRIECIEDLEKKLLEKFQRHSHPYLKITPQSEVEWLALGQHFGLPTRLLDWTENPLVALFFAVNEPFDHESIVWIIDPGYWYSMNFEIPLNEIKNIHMFFPKSIDNRIIAQKSCFSIHPLPKNNEIISSIEIDYENGNAARDLELKKVILPSDIKIKAEILRSLNTLGIDHQFIFPDLSGLCKKIIFEHVNDIPNE